MTVFISIDDRVRLLGAVLAATDWPQREQQQAPHATHQQAKLTAQFMAPYVSHPAVRIANELLNAGIPLPQLFTMALSCTWPAFEPQFTLPTTFPAADWVASLADFYVESGIAPFFWAEQEAVWAEAKVELLQIFAGVELPAFLNKLKPTALPAITITPNLTYSALTPILAETERELFVILPPPKAWGESPPWPYREGVEYCLAQAVALLSGFVWQDVFAEMPAIEQETRKHAAAVLFLEQALSEADGLAYMVRARKQYGMPALPAIVAELRK